MKIKNILRLEYFQENFRIKMPSVCFESLRIIDISGAYANILKTIRRAAIDNKFGTSTLCYGDFFFLKRNIGCHAKWLKFI